MTQSPLIAGRSGNLPPGWQAEVLADGSLRAYQTDDARRAAWGCAGPFAIAWNGMLLLLVAMAYGLLPGKWELEGFGPGWGLLPMLPFALLGAVFAQGGLWGTYGVEEWRASHNLLELRWGWKFAKKLKSRRYADGVWEVQENKSEDDKPYWKLSFECPNGWLNQGCVYASGSGIEGAQEQVQELAKLFAKHTGWPLNISAALQTKI